MQMLTVGQASKHYGVSPYTIRTWAKTGLIDGYRMGRGWFHVEKNSVDRFIAEMMDCKPPAPKPEQEQPGDYPGYLTVKQAANYLNVCEKTIYRRCNAGELATITIGRRRLVSVESLKKYVLKNSNVQAFPHKLSIQELTGALDKWN